MTDRLPKRRQLTLSRLKECLDYDRETGLFIWKKTGRKNNYAGQVAGTIHKSSKRDKTEYVFIVLDYVTHNGHILAWFYETGEYPEIGIDHSPHGDVERPASADGAWVENIAHGVKIPNAEHIAVFDPPTVLSLLDALEMAQGDCDEAIRKMSEWAQRAGFAKGALEASEMAGMIDGWRTARDAAIAERDSARALLKETKAELEAAWWHDDDVNLRVRITKELGQ
jgi:hypothetical protein